MINNRGCEARAEAGLLVRYNNLLRSENGQVVHSSMIVPTRRFWLWLALGIFLALAGWVVPGAERFLIYYNIVLFALLGVSALLATRPKQLKVRRKMDPVLSIHVANRVELWVTHEGDRPVQFRLADAPPPEMPNEGNDFHFTLDPGDEEGFSYHVTPRARGAVTFEDPYVRVLAPLGLCEVQGRLSCSQPTHVYPNVLALREFDLIRRKGKLATIGMRKTRLKGQGTEFESLRDYADDSFRKIDWKSTARRGKLIVRDYTTERNQPVIVCVDTGRNMLSEVEGITKLDYVLDACLLLLHAAAHEGDLTGLMVFSDQVDRLILPKKGKSQAGILLNAIHNLRARPVESNYLGAFSTLATRQKRRAMVVVFTDADDAATAERLAKAIAPLRRRHLVFVARISDPRVGEMASIELVTPEQMYAKAAGLWYESERREASMKLAVSGLQNIDAEPEHLAQALTTAYFVAKETSAL